MQVQARAIEPRYRESFDAASLRDRHPPAFTLPHKQALYDLACSAGPQGDGSIEVSRWPTTPPRDEGAAARAANSTAT